MEDKYLLSICIPTYNRADYLKQCLDNIVRQFGDKKIKDSIEIVISDNASKDNTENLAKEYQSRWDNIKYFRNEKNLGPDENMINSVLKAEGRYCWTIGDDDFIQNGGLNFIISSLEKKPVSLLTINFNPFIDLDACAKKIENIDEKLLMYFDSPEKFWSDGYCQGIFGILIFNKKLWLEIDRNNYEKLWAYYEIILKMIARSDLPLAHINYPLAFIGQDYRWNENGTALLVSVNFKKLLDKLTDYGYSKKFINTKKLIIAKSLPTAILSAKSYGLKCSFSNLKLIYKNFYNYPIYVFATALIFFIPNTIVKKLKSIKNKLKK
ncbi:MAG: glycosyltransferase family 2 protein [Candidatus Staskawiczbacteria bacterium]|nr:glycosyltransferase family 2 protein [Candidatus Staskawiczbacteria bacterium]